MTRWNDLIRWTEKQIRYRQHPDHKKNKVTEMEINLLNHFTTLVTKQSKAHVCDLSAFASEVMEKQFIAYPDTEMEISVIPTEDVIKMFMQLGYYNINKHIISNHDIKKAS